MSFGSNLEHIRKEKKISQAKLGKSLGLTQQMISSYEKDISSPNVEVLTKIANYFKISIDELVGHTIDRNDTTSYNARLLHYFETLADEDKERCLTIIQTIMHDRIM